jgi:hypothetical protein
MSWLDTTHMEKNMGAAAVGVAECGARAGHLVGARLAHDLQRRLRQPQQAGRAAQ